MTRVRSGLGWVVVSLAASAAIAATDPGTTGSFTPGMEQVSIPATQGATMDADVHYPSSGGQVDPAACPCPAIVFGHGFGRSKARYANVGAHLASRGFIAIMPNFAGGSDHSRNADDLVQSVDWIVARNSDSGSIFFGMVDTDHIGSSGHSAGGMSALVATSRDPRIVATAPMDPVDNGNLGQTALASVVVPVAITYSETSSCNNGSAATLYGAARPQKRGVKIVNGTHCDPEDPTDFLCTILCGSEDATRQYLYRKYMTGWFEYFLHCDASYEPWVFGSQVATDVSAGRVTYDADLTPSPPTGVQASGGSCVIDLHRDPPAYCNGTDGWRVYRATTSGGGYAMVGQALPSQSSFTDGSVTPGTTYYYVLRDVAGGVESADSTEVSAAAANAPPAVDFTGSPRTGPAPLTVDFTDLSSGGATVWSWAFGDGGTSSQQNPSHTYTALGSYDVTLTVTGVCGSGSERKVGYIQVGSGAAVDNYLVGPGAGSSNPNRARILSVGGTVDRDWTAYGAGGFGTNVAGADIDGADPEALTGPGPGAVFGPQVKAFRSDGSPVAKVSFYAYGTLKFGVEVSGGRLDGDSFSEVLTGGGPGAVFGPHVRAFDFDGTILTALARINFFAYGTLKYGVHVAGGDLDGDGYAEMVTGPGPSSLFAPQVRGWNFDGGSLASIGRINGNVFSTPNFGVEVAMGDATGDGAADGIFGPGPGASLPARVRGFVLSSGPMQQLAGLDVIVFSGLGYGLQPSAGDVTGDGRAEVVGGQGPDPSATSRLRTFSYDGSALQALPSGEFEAFSGLGYGVKVSSGRFGYP